MLSKLLKKAPAWFSALLVFAALANKDWENFFPLSSHADLRFQIIGESLEILVLVGVFVLSRMLFPRDKEFSASVLPAKRRAAFAGAFFGALLFVIFWRDYFPNDTFEFAEALKDVRYSLIAGVVVALFSLIPPARQGKPSKEDERSVV
jgi:hypothetical protein